MCKSSTDPQNGSNAQLITARAVKVMRRTLRKSKQRLSLAWSMLDMHTTLCTSLFLSIVHNYYVVFTVELQCSTIYKSLLTSCFGEMCSYKTLNALSLIV